MVHNAFSPHSPVKLFATLVIVVATSLVHASSSSDLTTAAGGLAFGQQVFVLGPQTQSSSSPSQVSDYSHHHSNVESTQQGALFTTPSLTKEFSTSYTNTPGTILANNKIIIIQGTGLNDLISEPGSLTLSNTIQLDLTTPGNIDYGAPPPEILTFGQTTTTDLSASLQNDNGQKASLAATAVAVAAAAAAAAAEAEAATVAQGPGTGESSSSRTLVEFSSSFSSASSWLSNPSSSSFSSLQSLSNVELTPATGLRSVAPATAPALESGGAGTKRFSGLKTTGLVVLGGALMGILI
ncbi:uncharacterized protein SAPINGB_P002278 [Magnusiomyces paraingens]|uniref:Uncharacterized protein n=1 Tax=Magnusiomyces paraingens TaxID=2606893 RepID=A0A5E8BFC5_9ASCO|nr:uncharacterized protein SAPINGB_P002278 [Saprochaete ingens]VVT49455.1 unnamed protein product [Saprochaete ingens]